jgi:hypothetical protein
MNADTQSSEPSSGATFPSERAPEFDSSESAFLTRESELTRVALARTLEELKASLRTSADLRVWTRRHPWAALGVAAAAGFSAATLVAARRDNNPSAPDENGNQSDEEPPVRRTRANHASKPLAATIFSSLFDLAKVALQSSIAATAAASAAPPDTSVSESANEDVAAP